MPGEQLVQAGLGMIGNTGDDVGERGMGIDIIEAAGLDQRIYDRGPFAAAIGACKHPVLAADGHGSDEPLGGVVGQTDPAIVEEAGKTVPATEHVVDGLGEIAFARERAILRA